MVEAGTALCVAGNHENKLIRALDGRKVNASHGLAESLSQLEAEPEEFRVRAREFMYGLVSHYRLDGSRLVVAHAGLREEYQGRASARVRSFACMATPPARPTSTGSRSATRGRTTTGVGRPSCTDTLR